MKVRRTGWLALAWSISILIPHLARAGSLYSTGFEASDGFTLNSALPSAPSSPTDWYRLDGPSMTTSPIVDINSTNNGGSQGLRIANQGPTFDQSDPDSNTFVESPIINVPGSSNLIANNTPYVSIKWDMRVDDNATSSNNSLYVGLDVYDALGDGIVSVARQAINGTPVIIGTDDTAINFNILGDAPASGAWANYDLELNFSGQTYQLFVNGISFGGVQSFGISAEDSLDIDFSDAGRGLDTAYFDNFSVTASSVPEPACAAFAGAGLLAALMRRRRTV